MQPVNTEDAIQHVWIFDGNRRIYPPAPKGRLWSSEGPIYREHWVKHDVVGETKISYITKYGGKVPKKGGRGFAMTLAEVEDDIWKHENRHKIASLVGSINDAALLRKVAEVSGYTPNES